MAVVVARAGVPYKETVTSSPIQTYRLGKRIAISVRTLSTAGGRRNRYVTA